METNQEAKAKNEEIKKKNRQRISSMSAVASYFNESNNPKLVKFATLLNTILFVVAIIVYVALGCTMQNWSKTWMIFIFVPVIPSILTAIGKRTFCWFMIPFLALGIYLAIGMNVPNGWHPYWAILLSIPVYYLIFSFVDKKNKKENDKKE